MHPIKCLSWLIVFIVGLSGVAVTATTSIESKSAAGETRSGRDFVRDLQRKETQSRAFYELWRGTRGREKVTFSEFVQTHKKIEVVACPQGGDAEPIYLVLSGSLVNYVYSGKSDYPAKDIDELFPVMRTEEGQRLDNARIDAFTAAGETIDPFGGRNVLQGSLGDITGDGVLERAEIAHYDLKKMKHVDVLEIVSVKTTALPILRVLINWGEDEWGYRLNDTKENGIPDIELGPRVGEGIKTIAVYRWDAAKDAYVGPKGKTGDHFRHLKSGAIEKQLDAFQSSKMTFPRDADFKKKEAVIASLGSRKPASAEPPPSKPYQRKSLAELSDTELLRQMGPGRNAYDFERAAVVREQVPSEFWDMKPKRAALTMAQDNRSAEHRASFQLALDDRGEVIPPEIGSVIFSDASSRCYNAVDAFYFLRVDPKESYLAYARSWSGGAVFYNVVHDQPAFDLRLCPLSYEDARHLAQTIWWLDRVRSRSIESNGMRGSSTLMSTADGSGRLILRDDAGTLLMERAEKLWSGEPSERWSGSYNHEVLVNFSGYLMTEILPKRIGKAWTDAAPESNQNNIFRQENGPRYTEQELQRTSGLIRRFLGWVSPNEERLSSAIATCAVNAAGTLVIAETKPLLEKILAELPSDSGNRRGYAELSDELNALLKAKPTDASDLKAWFKKETEIYAQMSDATAYSRENQEAWLRDATQQALRKLHTSADSAALYAWAISLEPGCQWAMQQLSTVNRTRYVDALEMWMPRENGRWAKQIFEEIGRVAPERAAVIAAAPPEMLRETLTTSAYSYLDAAGRLTDEQERMKALLAVLKTPKSGWEERGKAIDLLVPPETPLRYPQQEVDDALFRVLEPDMADAVVDFTRAKVCRALALRQRMDAFDRIAILMDSTEDGYLYDDMLSSLVQLAQLAPERFKNRIAEIVAPQLRATNQRMPELLWAIWAMDLRDFKPELARLGTGDVDDYEDKKAASSGGDVTPVLGRFHLARQIADVWNADDAVTQIRLLTALGLGNVYGFVESSQPERMIRLNAELAKSARSLTASQRERLESFFEGIEQAAETEDGASANRKPRAKLVALVRESIQAP